MLTIILILLLLIVSSVSIGLGMYYYKYSQKFDTTTFTFKCIDPLMEQVDGVCMPVAIPEKKENYSAEPKVQNFLSYKY
jgi:hypothetical protein